MAFCFHVGRSFDSVYWLSSMFWCGAGGVGVVWSIGLGVVKLEVIEGDITRATTDAIVNIASENLHLKQGNVSGCHGDRFWLYFIQLSRILFYVTQERIIRSEWLLVVRTDCAISVSSKHVDCRLGAVSAAILQVGGHEIQDECNKIGNIFLLFRINFAPTWGKMFSSCIVALVGVVKIQF